MIDKAVKLFISYSHRDEKLRQQLDKHLASLKRQNVIDTWHDRKIEAGMTWAKQIDDNLNQADIVLLLISPDFIFSSYCSEIEMEQAIKRHEDGEAIVVPIILEPCDWTCLPFSKYQAFPKNAKPITTWTNVNEALLDVIQGIRTLAERLFEQHQQRLKGKEAKQEQYRKKVEEILSADGEISIPGQDTLDELRIELGLTNEEANRLKDCAFEPYRRYKENLQKYEKTFLKVIQYEYPLKDKIKEDLKLRQRDLGIKPEDVKKIEKKIIAQRKSKEKESHMPLQYQVKGGQNLNSENQSEVNNNSVQPLEIKNETVSPIDTQLKEPVLQSEQLPGFQLQNATHLSLGQKFLELCQQELAYFIGPVAKFILDETLAEYPGIEPQQLIEVLSAEIPDEQQAKLFKENLS